MRWLRNGRHDQTEIRSLFGKRTTFEWRNMKRVWCLKKQWFHHQKNTHFYRNETLDDIIYLKVLLFLISFEIFVKQPFSDIFFLDFKVQFWVHHFNNKRKNNRKSFIFLFSFLFPLLSLFDCELLLLSCASSSFHSFEWKCVVFLFTLFFDVLNFFFRCLSFLSLSVSLSLSLFLRISGYSLTILHNNK